MALPIRRGQGGRSADMRAVEVTDFSGGLNLDAGQFNLAKNECAELSDMDVVGRGGVRRRRAVLALPNGGGTPFDACPRSVFTHETLLGDRYIFLVAPQVVSSDNRLLWYSKNGAEFTSLATNFGFVDNADVLTLSSPVEVPVRTAVVDNRVFGVFGWGGTVAGRPQSFVLDNSGSTPTVNILPETGCIDASPNLSGWTEQFTFETDSVASMMNGSCVASHYGFLWVGNLFEKNGAGTIERYGSRVHWSHAGVPDRWREDDWIDVEVGKDADQITALVPFRDHLLVFKNKSVHAIYGDSPDNFSVVNLSNEFGCVSQESVVATPFGVFFFDRNSGVWSWDGSQFRWRFEKLNSVLRDDTVPMFQRDNVHLGWVKNRLWVGVPWVGEPGLRGKTLVLDPSLPAGGAWTMYTLGVGPFASVRQNDETVLDVAGCSGTRFLQRLEQNGDNDQLTFDTGVAVDSPIQGVFRTPWLSFVSGAIKQWKRPDVVVSSVGGIDLVVDAFFNWDNRTGGERKTFYVNREASTGELVWVSTPPDSTVIEEWNNGSWRGGIERVLVASGTNIGRSLSLSMRFSTPVRVGADALPAWSVDGVVVKFRPKRVRG